ncbi:sigma-70 family RNA polymerase sigma factor [Ignavibacteria bacterium]
MHALTTTKTYADAELFAMLSGSTSEAQTGLAMLYDRYSQRIFTYCRKITGNSSAAEDLLQETFARFFESAKRVRSAENVAGYLFAIARNQCLNYKAKRREELVLPEDIELASRDRPYEQQELLDILGRALDLLPDDYREAFILREYNGMSYNEIAETIGVSLDIVKIRLFRAKKKLREILAPYLIDLNV